MRKSHQESRKLNANNYQKTIKLCVNDQQHTVKVENRWTLLRLLREELGLTAAKCGCDMGECGACTVLLEEDDEEKPVLACLMLAVDAEGKKIRTLEGLSKNGQLHPIQKAFVEKNALMCGFCTPGTIMTTKALLSRNSEPSEDEVKYALRGNLCRCGLYPRTIQGVLEASRKMNGGK